MKITGRVVVVTGGGSGIGAALCRRFHREQAAELVVVDRDGPAAREVAADLGGRAIECDVSVESQVKDVVRGVIDAHGRLDLLCSNAGIGGDGGIETDDAVWRACWQTNVMSLLYAARAAVPAMIAQGGGYLLNTISAAGMLTAPGALPYGASKHAALALTEALAIEYGDRGVAVSALCPGAVKTPLLMEKLDMDTRRAMLAVSPLVSPEDAAERVLRGIEREDFLILTHPETANQYVQRATDTDRWLRGVRAAVGAVAPSSSGDGEVSP